MHLGSDALTLTVSRVQQPQRRRNEAVGRRLQRLDTQGTLCGREGVPGHF